MEKRITKKQHYIPQFYLRRFTDNAGYLHIYDFDKQRYIKSVPKEFGYEKYLYETRLSKPNRMGEQFLLTNDIENIFAKYEGEFDNFLKKLDRICTPTQRKGVLILHGEEKDILRRFIANMFFRNPITMDRLNLNEVPADFFEPDAKEKFNQFLDIIGGFNADELVSAAIKKVMLTDELEKNNIKSFVEQIQNLWFTFLYSERLQFITSSFPVILGNDKTIPTEDKSCIYVALSPSVSVVFGNYQGSKEKHNRLAYVDDEVVDFFNRQQIMNITYLKGYLIAPSKMLIEEYCKKREE